MTDLTGIVDTFDREQELAFVQRVLARHPDAVADFTERMQCVPRMLAAMNARGGSRLCGDDLADLVQETIAIALRKLGEFRAFGMLESWLYRLCTLEFLNAIRRKARRQRRHPSIEEIAGEVPGAHPSLQSHDDVHVALERLGGVEAEVIRLKHFDDLTFSEIGRRLGQPANTAKTRYHRGLTKLEGILRMYQRREHEA